MGINIYRGFCERLCGGSMVVDIRDAAARFLLNSAALLQYLHVGGNLFPQTELLGSRGE